jgi:hypothetical protein
VAGEPPLVTTTSTAPVAWGPVAAVMVFESTTLTLVAATPPTVTMAPLWKLPPEMVTGVPPAVEPWFGAMPVTAGGLFCGVMQTPRAFWILGLTTATVRGWKTISVEQPWSRWQ